MIGEVVERQIGFRKTWPIWLGVTAAMVVGDLFMNDHHLLILALAPLGVALAALTIRPVPFRVEFRPEGIKFGDDADDLISYDSIEALCEPQEGQFSWDHFPFELVHRDGVLSFPAELNEPSQRIFDFLRDYERPHRHFSPPAELRSYLEYYEREFGRDGVRDCRSLPDPRPDRNFLAPAVCAALACATGAWAIIGAESRVYEELAGIGGLAMVVCSIAFIGTLVSATRHGGGQLIDDGGLVITPVGFALKQNDLCGEMRWDEVTSIRYPRSQPYICIAFEGGEIRLRDVYDRRLSVIFNRLVDFREGITTG